MRRLWTGPKVSDALVWVAMTSVLLCLLQVELGRFFGNWEGGTYRSELAVLFSYSGGFVLALALLYSMHCGERYSFY